MSISRGCTNNGVRACDATATRNDIEGVSISQQSKTASLLAHD
jgi:hypothetical protein